MNILNKFVKPKEKSSLKQINRLKSILKDTRKFSKCKVKKNCKTFLILRSFAVFLTSKSIFTSLNYSVHMDRMQSIRIKENHEFFLHGRIWSYMIFYQLSYRLSIKKQKARMQLPLPTARRKCTIPQTVFMYSIF